MPDVQTNPTLGQRILSLREQQKLSLRTLAERVGLSASFLSQVERDETSPSIASLDKIAHALGVDLATFFQQSPPDPVTRKAERTSLESAWSKARIENLTRVAGKLHPRLLTLKPGGSTGLLSTANTETFLLVLQGTLKVNLAQEVVFLEEGDAVHAPREHHLTDLGNSTHEDAIVLIITLGAAM
jgi:transcriptional regulator with XRE-family HTH domain